MMAGARMAKIAITACPKPNPVLCIAPTSSSTAGWLLCVHKTPSRCWLLHQVVAGVILVSDQVNFDGNGEMSGFVEQCNLA